LAAIAAGASGVSKPISETQYCGAVLQLLLKSKTRYFSRGSIIADSREDAKGLVVITAGQVELLFHLLKLKVMPNEQAMTLDPNKVLWFGNLFH
jgi:hypothetical protein